MQEETMSVLVVDDDPAVLRSVVLLLKRTGWTVYTAMSAAGGLALLKKSPPDVILWDAALPDVTGPQLVTAIKSDPSTAHIRVVLMTGLGDRTIFSQTSWDGFLEKPFGPKELLEVIERVLPSF